MCSWKVTASGRCPSGCKRHVCRSEVIMLCLFLALLSLICDPLICHFYEIALMVFWQTYGNLWLLILIYILYVPKYKT